MGKKTLIWIAQIILFLGFIFFGIGKFITSPAEGAQVFGRIGGASAQYFTGAYEIVSAVLIVIPATSFLGALMIAISMVVAIILHLTVIGVSGGFLGLTILAVVFLAISVYVMLKRREDFLKR